MNHFNYNDGGRKSAGYKGSAGDCVTRAIAIATNIPYKEVYKELFKRAGHTPRNGMHKRYYEPYLKELGFVWIPTSGFGIGFNLHLNPNELPKGIIIARVTKHLCTVIDGVINDTSDCSRNGKRGVYGYYQKL